MSAQLDASWQQFIGGPNLITLENAATTTEEHGTDAEYNSADLN